MMCVFGFWTSRTAQQGTTRTMEERSSGLEPSVVQSAKLQAVQARETKWEPGHVEW